MRYLKKKRHAQPPHEQMSKPSSPPTGPSQVATRSRISARVEGGHPQNGGSWSPWVFSETMKAHPRPLRAVPPPTKTNPP